MTETTKEPKKSATFDEMRSEYKSIQRELDTAHFKSKKGWIEAVEQHCMGEDGSLDLKKTEDEAVQKALGSTLFHAAVVAPERALYGLSATYEEGDLKQQYANFQIGQSLGMNEATMQQVVGQFGREILDADARILPNIKQQRPNPANIIFPKYDFSGRIEDVIDYVGGKSLLDSTKIRETDLARIIETYWADGELTRKSLKGAPYLKPDMESTGKKSLEDEL